MRISSLQSNRLSRPKGCFSLRLHILVTPVRLLFPFYLSFLLFPISSFASQHFPGKVFFTIDNEQKKALPDHKINFLQARLKEHDGILTVKIHFLNKPEKKKTAKNVPLVQKDIQVGGQLTLFLDDFLYYQHSFTGNELKIQENINPYMLKNGDHTLRVEILSYPGGRKAKKIRFHFDATPLNKIKSTTTSGKTFDPQVYLLLPQSGNKTMGMMEVRLDGISVATVPLTKDHINKFLHLSKFIDRELDVYRLANGTHLFSIAVTAANGSKSGKYVPIEINSKPEFLVKFDKDKHVESITVNFPKIKKGFIGAVNVYYRHAAIFSRQAKDAPRVVIVRADIDQAFSKYKYNQLVLPVDLIFAAQAGNGSETWFIVKFR